MSAGLSGSTVLRCCGDSRSNDGGGGGGGEGTAGLVPRQPSLQKSSFKTFGEELVELPRTSH